MEPLLAGWTPSGFEWIILLIVALLIFGHKLPSVMRSLGSSVGEFKKGVRDSDIEAKSDAGKTPQTAPPSAPAQTTAADPEKK
jgi:sec-independent protein translocase protein TatA